MPKLRLTDEQIALRMKAFETIIERAGRITCDTPAQAQEILRAMEQIEELSVTWAEQQLKTPWVV